MNRPESPLVRLPYGEDTVDLHWYNSCIRLFNDEQYNHVELYEDDGVRGLRVGQFVIDILFENDFPTHFLPYVDESTHEWFIKSEMSIMEREIEDL